MDYMQGMLKRIDGLGAARPPLVLHSCCAVCLSSVLGTLEPHFDITVLCCNPNIDSFSEYVTRRDAQLRFISESGSRAKFDEIQYCRDGFLSAVCGLENEPEGGARCKKCFSHRLSETARYAAHNNIEFICSTLTVSPHKNAENVNNAGQDAAEQCGIEWLPSDFKKKNGYLRSIQLARQFGIYQQDYCGCEFARRPLSKESLGRGMR